VLALGLAAAPTLAGAPPGEVDGRSVQDAGDLAQLSLEELASISVSTATRREQRLDEVPAAVWAVTQDDIRRSGATSLPEALRLAPGLHVAQIDATTWAISARGFNGRFADKLLVLMDGRTLYSPSFGGVFWNVADTLLDDVERIEVIRGPGTALWGANAVNGVVNIITKSAAQTQGALATLDHSLGEGTAAALRVGGAAAAGEWRTYVKRSAFDGAELSGGDGPDAWHESRAGARLDTTVAPEQALRLQADAYEHVESHDYFPVPGVGPEPGTTERWTGASLVAQWRRTLADGGALAVQGYVDRARLDGFYFNESRTTYDLDLQHDLGAGGERQVLWGASARATCDRVPPTFFARVSPEHDCRRLYGAFLQQELALRPDLVVTAGLKAEYDDAAGPSWLPNLRLRWTVDEAQTVWAALSRAARQPSRSDLALEARAPERLGTALRPDGVEVPVYVALHGNPDLQAEVALAAEAGWRRAFGGATLDVATFWTHYDRLKEFSLGQLHCEPSGLPVAAHPSCLLATTALVQDSTMSSTGRTAMRGVEVTFSWQAADAWRLVGNWSWIDEASRRQTGPASAQPSPASHLAQLRSSLYLGHDVEWDLFARYASGVARFAVPQYVDLNTRVAWRPSPDLELAVVGRDLLHRRRVEQVSELHDVAPTPVHRSAWLQLRWQY
jgi:iron complex outermembrane receptor protein